LKEEGQYTAGKKSGEWKTYNEDGDLLVTDVFD
jgi:antitoxin component YwqK of YwqJK toxin-antitoxin module